MASLCLAIVLMSSTAQIQFHRLETALTIEGPAYRCVLDARTGALARLGRAGSPPLSVGNADGNLWRLRFRDNSWLTASEAAAKAPVEARWDETKGTLTLAWRAEKANVTVALMASQDRLEAVATVVNHWDQPALTLVLPSELAMPKDGLRLLTWPESTGLGLTAKWLEPPSDEAPSRWQDEPVADRLFRRLMGFGAQMLDLPGTAKPLQVTEMGRALLDSSVVSRLTQQEAAVVRPPEGSPDAVILETDDGPYLSAFQLGGTGWFAYFAGGADEDVALPVVPNLIRAWAGKVEGGKVGLISLRGRGSGGWMSVAVRRWEETLPHAVGNLGFFLIRSAAELRAALADSQVAAIVNPYGEHLPADSLAEGEALIDELKAYVQRGGVWIDSSGYPFYYLIKRGGYGRFTGSYPPMFADFVHLSSDNGQLAVYRTQLEREIFVPARLELKGADVNGQPAAVFSREFGTWVEPGKTWQAPPVVLLLGHDLKAAAQQYVSDNGFTRRLSEKMPTETLRKFRESLLLRLTGRRAADYLAYLPKVPSPTIVHMTEHLHVGFDKAYPDYLPPQPEFGTMDELRELYRRGHELGLLMMPYVNPTWWCDQSPSLAKYGDAVLAVGLDGKTYREAYGYSEPRSRGYSICALHPLVRELDDKCLRDFVDDLKSDVLFQDQIGARGWIYDLNPAEPTPYAYAEGMIEIARNDSKYVPLSTERGWDRIMNYEVQFCGVGYAVVPKKGRELWSPCFWEFLGDGEWQSSPVALYMGHDKVAFALHDLGHFVDDEEALAMALPAGHQLSLSLAVGTPEGAQRYRWMQWLDTLQKQVASQYMLEPLDSFRHLRQLALEACYGPLTVVGSLEKEPVTVGSVELASPGYYVAREDGTLEAGRLVKYSGQSYDQAAPLEFVRRRQGKQEQWWLYGTGRVVLPAGTATRAAVKIPEGEVPAALIERDGVRWVEAQAPTAGVQPPAELAALEPAKWPQPPRFLGVISMEPGGPSPGWADAGPDQWIDALNKSPVVGKLLLEVRKLTVPDDILRACAEPRRWFAILNPYGELFPVPSANRVSEMLDAVSRYIEHGGIWWETGGFSFYYPWWPVVQDGRIVRWEGGSGMGGLSRIVGPAEVLPDDPPAEPVIVTKEGRNLLPPETVGLLQGASAVVNRPMSAGHGGWSLMTGQHGDYVAGYQAGGWGYLFRVGGKGQIKLSLPFVEGTLAYLFRTPPKDWPNVQPARTWSLVLE